jgi:pimeloyl-ACP methyl ester carboxylesterase
MLNSPPQLLATSGGDIAWYRAETDPSLPVVAFLHGALRRSEALFPWAARLAGLAEPGFFDLPGHGYSAASGPAAINGMALCIHEALSSAYRGRRVLLVGESLGGAVALAAAGLPGASPLRGVMAADPPMTTAKLWQLADVLRKVMANAAPDSFVQRLADETFGLSAEGAEDHIYYPLIAALRTSAVVIATGDVPLLPIRRTTRIACLFDAVDRFVVDQLYPGKAHVVQIPDCGHVVLGDAPEACLELIVGLLSSPEFQDDQPVE